MTATDELWPLIHEQRDKIGDLLDTLSQAEWDAQSLCEGWRIRDVVSHLIQTHMLTQLRLVANWVGSGLSMKGRNARGVALRAPMSNADLLREYRATAHRASYLPGQLSYSLIEAVIHGEDVARPLGRRLDPAPKSLVIVADVARGTDPILGGKRRSEGLTLRATDVDWSAGSGPDVTGPLGSIILAITGRPAGLADLSGDGLPMLRSRV